ncbi:MAG: hypothetical protein GF401_09905 [Chitinivibrionales bacterium]|nr:hypothetical protein [Chitinivibrionales bacterium]
MYNPKDPKSLEKYSSAITLSDMEVFIFPELMYALVLANTMSPLPWAWRQDSWFAKMKKMSPYRKVLRLKQFIMDRFVFNLDLDTWGLTTKERELARFSDFVDETILSQSNALFGYEGDKYYFDLDIRRHFGLDKYTSDIIPYWKTETVEAMDAFRYKGEYPTGAGECVSLSTLYASALFVVAEIPLEKIYLMATPLHSQNFVDIKEGIITNNRRIVTKNMWFNGTELSAKAQRALRNERVTVLINNEGYIHTIYDEATLSRESYQNFSSKLMDYLKTDINFDILANFLRHNTAAQKCFQFSHRCCGKPRFIEAEKVFHYEHSSKSRANDATRTALLHEIDEDEFYTEPLGDRVLLDELESFFQEKSVSIDSPYNVEELKKHLHHGCYNVDKFIKELLEFSKIDPRLPGTGKQWIEPNPIRLQNDWSREKIFATLESLRAENEIVDLAFMAYRDMARSPWKPFCKAALQRNPVCVTQAHPLDIEQVAQKLSSMENFSIYDSTRMAQPDEVWNFGRGDGLEKAFCLMTIAHQRMPEDRIALKGDKEKVCVCMPDGKEYQFQTSKGLELPKESDFEF